MLGEEVMKVEKEDYVNALVQLSKDSTMLHKCDFHAPQSSFLNFKSSFSM